jgi:hypothetical protein
LQQLLNVTGNALLDQMYQAASINSNTTTLNTLDVMLYVLSCTCSCHHAST